MPFSFPYETKVTNFHFGDIDLSIETLRDLDSTIDAFFADYEKTGNKELFGDLSPYFGVAWPAGQALANFVQQKSANWQGLRVVEIGCGLALPSLVLAKSGLQVLAMDLHPDVPVFLEKNKQRNGITSVEYVSADWRTWEAPAEIIIGSDILYDREQPEALLQFLQNNLSRYGEAWITDPGRPFWERFVARAREVGFVVEEQLFQSIFLLHLSRKA